MLFAAIGQEWFGGLINTKSMPGLLQANEDIKPLWIYINFNDYAQSMNSLFGIIWLNDW